MIDLNLKPKQIEQDEPIGKVIICLMPFVLVFVAMVFRGL